MTGQESDAATLFRLYVNYGRYTEATNLLLEYLETHATLVCLITEHLIPQEHLCTFVN
jgi:hypothetical protein